MGRKKQKRFEEVVSFQNCFDRDDVGPGGRWVGAFFGNDRPLILELGCGKGEYSLALAGRFPSHNVIGIDKRSDRFWKAARPALAHRVSNVAFLRADVADLELYLDPRQVETIWIPFPDPRPKRRQAKHRILSEPFLEMYSRILSPGGVVHVKTDDPATVEGLLEAVEGVGGTVLSVIRDIDAEAVDDDLLLVRTTFERRHLERGRTVRYVAFQLSL